MQPGYTVPFTDVALSAATAKTVVAMLASKVATLDEACVSFDGVTATNTPVLIEFVKGDGTSAGTTTAVTPLQVRGRPVAAASTAAKNYTAEPTVLTVLKVMRFTPISGIVYQLPLGREIESDSVTNKLIGIRITAAQTVNVTGWLEFEE